MFRKSIKKANGVSVGNSATNAPVSAEAALSNSGANRGCRFEAQCSNVTAGVTLKLQCQLIDTSWVDVKSVSVTADGVAVIRLHHSVTADAALMPVAPVVRLAVTTDGTGTVDVGEVALYQEP